MKFCAPFGLNRSPPFVTQTGPSTTVVIGWRILSRTGARIRQTKTTHMDDKNTFLVPTARTWKHFSMQQMTLSFLTQNIWKKNTCSEPGSCARLSCHKFTVNLIYNISLYLLAYWHSINLQDGHLKLAWDYESCSHISHWASYSYFLPHQMLSFVLYILFRIPQSCSCT